MAPGLEEEVEQPGVMGVGEAVVPGVVAEVAHRRVAGVVGPGHQGREVDGPLHKGSSREGIAAAGAAGQRVPRVEVEGADEFCAGGAGEAAEEDEEAARMSREGKVSVTSNPGETATMNVPRNKRPDLDITVDDFEEDEIDPELRYSFQRNSRFLRRVFSVDTLVKPLPPVMAYSVSRNVNFFFKIFTQFWDEEGIANAQRSLGLGNDDGSRRVR